MPSWHIVDRRILHGLARLRRWQGLMLLALGVAIGLALARPDGAVAIAHAQSIAQPPAAERGWCEPAARGLRLSCDLAVSR